MNPEFFERVTELFDAVRHLPRAERMAYLDESCGGDGELRAEVESLLVHHDAASSLISESTLDDPPDLGAVRSPGAAIDRIGPFKILDKLGEGGMGVVYLGEQTEPVRRRAAVKVIKLGMDTREVVARFEAERQALALMDHPNIARIFDAGATEDGRPYFAMEAVEGIPITQYCDRHKLSVAGRLELFLQACQGVQHAHGRGIIHRDIKPSNILVGMPDEEPVAKIIDFGVARATNQRLTEKTVYTELGRAVGTPEFMSPEQAEMSGERVDHRTDIYSLGVLLYELLVGQPPLELDVQSVAFDEIVRRIREEEPITPSTRWSRLNVERSTELAAERHTSPGSLRSGLRGDLDWITMKALEKERDRRYATASEFAADIGRHLRHEPILASSPSATYRLRKAWRRNKVVYSAGLAVVAALITGIVVSAWQATVATLSSDEARVNLRQAVEAEARAQKALVELRAQNYVGDIGLAYEAIRRGDLGRAQDLLGKHRPGPDEEDLRGFEWRLLWSHSQGNHTADLGRYHGFLSGVAISPDGKLVAVRRGSDPERVEVMHLATGTVAQTLESGAPLIYSPGGDVLVGKYEGKVLGWDTRTWQARDPLPVDFPLAFGHRAERKIFVAVDGDHLSVWDAIGWKKIGDLANRPGAGGLLDPGYGRSGHMTHALAVSSDDRFAYLAGASGVRRWDLSQRTELAPFRVNTPRPKWGEGLSCLATSAKGQLAVADRWGQVRLLDPETGQILHPFDSHIGWVSCLKFTEDGSRLVSAGADRNVVLYDPVKQSVVDRLLGHRTQIWGLDISASGETVVSGSGYGGHVLTWSSIQTRGSALDRAGIEHFALLSDSRILVYRDAARDLEFYDPITDRFEPARAERLVDFVLKNRAQFVAASVNAKWIAVSRGKDVEVWNLLEDGRERTLSPVGVPQGAFSPDSGFLVTSGKDSEVRLWRTDDWTSEVLLDEVPEVWGISFSKDSRQVALAHDAGPGAGFIRVFDLTRGPRQFFEEKRGTAFSVALSDSGRWLVSGHAGGTIRVWDMETKEEIETLKAHVQGVFSLSFSPDERTLATGDASTSVRLWNVATWQEMLNVEADAHNVQFSPDGRYLAVMVVRSGSDLFQGEWAGLRILKTPTLAEIDASRASQPGRR